MLHRRLHEIKTTNWSLRVEPRKIRATKITRYTVVKEINFNLDKFMTIISAAGNFHRVLSSQAHCVCYSF